MCSVLALFLLIQHLTKMSSSSRQILASSSKELEILSHSLFYIVPDANTKSLLGSMFSRVQSRTLSIVKPHPDNTNDVPLPARKGKHYEETPDHRLRHLCPVPVSVQLTCGNEHAFNQSGYSLHSTDRHREHAERLPGPARSASPTQPGVPRSKCSTCHGSGWGEPATSRRN